MDIKMNYNWIDYSPACKELIESWIDEDAKRFTGLDDGFDAYYRYWANDPQTKIGTNFWVKIIISDAIPIGIIALSLWNDVFTISEFVIRPDKRGKNLGSSALKELLTQSRDIIGIKIETANAVIFPNNIASQKAFEKVGFIFHSEHPDGDACNYKYYQSALRS